MSCTVATVSTLRNFCIVLSCFYVLLSWRVPVLQHSASRKCLKDLIMQMLLLSIFHLLSVGQHVCWCTWNPSLLLLVSLLSELFCSAYTLRRPDLCMDYSDSSFISRGRRASSLSVLPPAGVEEKQLLRMYMCMDVYTEVCAGGIACWDEWITIEYIFYGVFV